MIMNAIVMEAMGGIGLILDVHQVMLLIVQTMVILLVLLTLLVVSLEHLKEQIELFLIV